MFIETAEDLWFVKMFCNSFKRKLKYGLKYGCCSFNFFHKPVATEWLDTVHTRARLYCHLNMRNKKVKKRQQ